MDEVYGVSDVLAGLLQRLPDQLQGKSARLTALQELLHGACAPTAALIPVAALDGGVPLKLPDHSRALQHHAHHKSGGLLKEAFCRDDQ